VPLQLEEDELQSPTDLGRHRVSRSNCSRAVSDLGSLLSATQRLQKITLGEMRESGPTRIVVYCADYRCAHSVVVDAARWVTTFACRTSSRSLLAGSAGAVAPMSGHYLSGPNGNGW
jgi:hypothetical protein